MSEKKDEQQGEEVQKLKLNEINWIKQTFLPLALRRFFLQEKNSLLNASVAIQLFHHEGEPSFFPDISESD